MEASMSVRKVTVATLAGLKARNEKAVFVTAYDYPTATFADRAGVDMIPVGGSAARQILWLPATFCVRLPGDPRFPRARSTRSPEPLPHALVARRNGTPPPLPTPQHTT